MLQLRPSTAKKINKIFLQSKQERILSKKRSSELSNVTVLQWTVQNGQESKHAQLPAWVGLENLPMGRAHHNSSVPWCQNGIWQHKPAQQPISFHSTCHLTRVSFQVWFPFLTPEFTKAAAPWFSKFSLLLPHFVQFTVPCCRTVPRLLAPQVIYSSLALLFCTNKKPIASYAYGHFLQIFCRKKIVPALLLVPPPPSPPWMAVGLNYKEHFLNISSKMTFIIIFSLTFQKINLLCKFPIAAVTNFHQPRRLK